MSSTINYRDLTNPLDQNSHIESLIEEKFNLELRSRIANRLQVEHSIKKGRSSKKIFRLLPVLSGIAASFLVLFMFINNRHTSDIQHHVFVIESIDNKLVHPGQTKGEAGNEVNRNLAIALFNKQDYTESYSAFSQIESPIEEDLFYKAMCQFYISDFESAHSELLPLLKTDSSFYEEVRWFLAITELKLGDHQSAKELLSGISKKEWNYAKGQDLLKSLN